MVEEVQVRVIDCGTAAIGQGFVVLEAAKAAAKGASLSEVVRRAEDLIPKVNLFATLDTLEYLHRGGRVPAVAALLTSVLKIKPIIYLKDGEVGLLEKPRTKARAIKRMIEIMGERVGSRKVHVAVFHTDALKEAERLKSEIEVRFNCEEIFVTEFTPVMGAHTGPGLLGLAFWVE
jgi:DegV family protein with EDD domain